MPVICMLASFVLASSVPPPGGRMTAWERASHLVFAVPTTDFVAAADDPHRDPAFDWGSDGCSAPLLGSTGRTFDFTAGCRRHDFAYRNLSRIDGGRRWTPMLRMRIDRVFLADMRTDCARRPRFDRAACRSWALVYFNAVRAFAGP